MKKVCLVDFDLSKTGGVEQVTESLANALSEIYDVHVISIQFENHKLKYKFNENVKFFTFNKQIENSYAISKESFKPFRRYLKDNDIDVVLLMGHYAAYASLFAQKTVKTKFIFCDHGALRSQWDDKKITLIRLLASKISDAVVTLTEQSKNDYIKRFFLSRKKIYCIHNWVEDEHINKENTYNANSKMIISVGRMSKEKGYDLLFKVAQKVLPNNPKWQWHIYGDGECFSDISKMILEKNLSSQLILKGNVDNVKELYKDYAFLVLTSYREGLPLVLLEAKANYLPLVSFDVATGPNEIIRDNIDGRLVEPYDVEKMANIVQDFINNEELRKQMSCNSMGNIEKFRKKVVLQQWINLIDDLA